jgi:hypothetical protein
MKRTFTYFLVVGVPGLCFLIAGAVNHEYPVAVLGGALVIAAVYRLSRKQVTMAPASDHKRPRLSLVLAGIIGVSFAVSGFASHQYWLAAVGVFILIGSVLQLHRTTPNEER